MELESWHYRVFKAFYNLVFGKSFNEQHIVGNGTTYQQESYYGIRGGVAVEFTTSNVKDTFYIKLKKDGKNYILPERFVKDMPFLLNPKDVEQIRLKRYDTTVYNFIKDVTTLKVPAVKTKSYKQFVDEWNPVKHEDPRSQTFLKIMAFAWTHGLKLGICSETSSGKNSNMILLKNLLGRTAPKIKSPTKAAFWQHMCYNDRLNIDEITSWTKAEVQLIEDMLVDIADESPDTDKSSLDQTGKIAATDLVKKGLTFTFNPISKKNPRSFASRFSNADKIEDRYPLLMLQGKVLSAIKTPSPAKAESMMVERLEEIKEIAKNLQYFIEEIDKEQHNWNRRLMPFERRHEGNTNSLISHIDAYCETQEEFDEWMVWVKERAHLFKQANDFNEEDLGNMYDEVNV